MCFPAGRGELTDHDELTGATSSLKYFRAHSCLHMRAHVCVCVCVAGMHVCILELEGELGVNGIFYSETTGWAQISRKNEHTERPWGRQAWRAWL